MFAAKPRYRDALPDRFLSRARAGRTPAASFLSVIVLTLLALPSHNHMMIALARHSRNDELSDTNPSLPSAVPVCHMDVR